MVVNCVKVSLAFCIYERLRQRTCHSTADRIDREVDRCVCVKSILAEVYKVHMFGYVFSYIVFIHSHYLQKFMVQSFYIHSINSELQIKQLLTSLSTSRVFPRLTYITYPKPNELFSTCLLTFFDSKCRNTK